MTSEQPTRDAWMQVAIDLAVQSVNDGGGPFGAVVVQDDMVIGRGQNRVTLDNDPTSHAEVVAIRQACEELGCFSLAGCELFTSCEPCPMCLGAILWSRLDGVWYANTRSDAAAVGFDDQAFYDEFSKPVSKRQLPMRQLLVADASVPFDRWRMKDDKTRY